MCEKIIRKEVRLSLKEKQKLKDLSLASGLTESDVIRKLLDSAIIKELPKRDFYDAIDKIYRISVSINQLLKFASMTDSVYNFKLNYCFNEIKKMIDKIKEKYL